MPVSASSALERVLERADRMVDIHREYVKERGRPPERYSDVLRGAVVMIMSALDAHVTDAVASAVPRVVRAGQGGPDVLRWIKESPEEVLNWVAAADAETELRDFALSRFSEMTFQRPDAIQKVLDGTIQADLSWETVFVSLSGYRKRIRSEKDVRDALWHLAQRRNQIAHEGDLLPSGRTRAIRRDFVEFSTDVVREVGRGVDVAVAARLREL